MRSVKRRQRRSVAWGVIYLCALVLVAAYILFDLLDVDGSQLPGRAAGTTIAAVLQPAPLGRGFHGQPTPFGGPEVVSPTAPCLTQAGRSGVAPVSAAFRLRLAGVRPRVHLPHEATLSSPDPTDPA